MSKSIVGFVCLIALNLSGCKGYVTTTPGVSVEVTGRVLSPDGTPVAPANVYFQATGGSAQPASFAIGTDGTFTGKMISGQYAYSVVPAVGPESRKSETLLKTLPENYTKMSLSRQIDVVAGALNLKFQ